MPFINRDQWSQVESLLDHALDLSAAERLRWLKDLRTSAPELATLLTQLLEADALADRQAFLSAPQPMSLTGLELGHYSLVRPLGQGGMGTVWLARRIDGRYQGQAAVKLMNLALMSTTGQARFRREGSALARLTHPAIARLLDAGVSPGGQPYLVIEYVDGHRIDAYATSAKLSLEQRLELVLQVLDAVSHAHANLIVHRDLKPSNILVTAQGKVKLLDFGIAKLLDDHGDGEPTALTADGAGALTPDYASPEQIQGEPVTTATDVYALGVLLYLLLSGRHPTRGASATPAQVVQAALEVEPPSLPLGDLGTIIAKALRKNPAERYQTAAALADDLRRYLRHEPVSARPDSLLYRAGKLVRRNRTAVAAAVVTGIVLVGATAFSVWQARRVSQQRDAAVRDARRATALVELQGITTGDSRGADGQPLSAAERIALAEEVLVQRFRGEPWLVTEAMANLARQFYESGDRDAQRAMLARARSIAGDNELPANVAVTSCVRAASFWYDNLADSIDADLRLARDALRRTPSPIDTSTQVLCLEAEAKALEARGHGDSAVALLRQAVAIVDHDSTSPNRLPILFALSDVLRLTGHPREAAVYQRRNLDELRLAGYGNTEVFPNVVTYLDGSLADLGEFRTIDSLLGGYIGYWESKTGPGQVPRLVAFMYGRNKLRLGELDSADLWIGRTTRSGLPESAALTTWLPAAMTQLRLGQGRLREAEDAAARLPDGTRGRRATAAMLGAMLMRARGKSSTASRRLESELATLYRESPKPMPLFALPLVTAGEWRLATGDSHGADSLAQLGRIAAAVDSLAASGSGLVGRAELLLARVALARGEAPVARKAASRAVAALAHGYGEANQWTQSARAVLDSLQR